MALLKVTFMIKKLFALSLLFSAVFSHAQPIASAPYYSALAVPITAPVPRVIFPTTIVGNVATFGPVTANAANAANFSFGAAANGAVFANTGSSLATAGGNSVVVGVSSRIPKAAVAAAMGRFVTRGLPLISTVSSLFQLAKELNVIVKNADGGAPSFSELTSDKIGDCQTSFSNVLAQNIHYAVSADSTGYCTVFEKVYDGSTTFITSGYPTVSSGTKEVPITPTEFIQRLTNKNDWGPGSSLAQAVKDSLQNGVDSSVEPYAVAGPQSIPGISTKTSTANDPATNASTDPAINPNTSTRTESTANNYSYNGPSVTTSTSTSNQTVNNFNNAVTSSSTTTTAPVVPEAQPEVVTCGLPGKPKCQIDELDTPKPDPAMDGKKAADDALTKLKEFGVDPQKALPPLPSLNWAFALPTGCTAFSIAVFAPYLQSIDICQFQPMFHDIMSMVWTIGGLFGAIGLFWRNTLSQN